MTADLPNITDGITDADAETSATLDVTVDEIRRPDSMFRASFKAAIVVLPANVPMLAAEQAVLAVLRTALPMHETQHSTALKSAAEQRNHFELESLKLAEQLAAAIDRAEKAEAQVARMQTDLATYGAVRDLAKQRRQELYQLRDEHCDAVTAENFDLRTRAEKAETELAEMTRCRDNALRHADREHVPIDLGDSIDTDGTRLMELISDALSGPGWDWEGDNLATVVADVLAVVRPHLARFVDQARRAETDYAICFEEWSMSVRTAGERGAELFIRANEAEIRAQAADVLRARLAEIGDHMPGPPLHVYRRPDGRIVHADLDRCLHAARTYGGEALVSDTCAYVSPWRPVEFATGGVVGPGAGPVFESGCTYTLPSRADVKQQAGEVRP